MDIKELHQKGLEDLNEFWEQLSALEKEIGEISDESPDFVLEQAERIQERLHAFEPTVSVIGQIKAGKSTLVNALVGQTDLLPSDVNPWTSVITSLHLNSRNRPPNTRALFRFFDSEEWDRLVEGGGRLGEMAQRAGFDSEFETVRQQVETMRQSTEARLGDEFQSLLGTSRSFPEIDKSVIDRYICYGDPDDLEDGGDQEGVYADLTKQADLYVEAEGFPQGICIRDTPGVNDTFMMREQITLNAISESRICIVVLSAHQALSTMDMALMRIICSIESREVVIFVNRIDELTDPARETEQIEHNIRRTLNRFGLDSDVEVLFGSGYWATQALNNGCATMMENSRQSLDTYLPGTPDDIAARAMEASGIEALHRSIAVRVIEGPGEQLAEDVRSQIDKIVEMRKTMGAVGGKAQLRVTVDDIQDKLGDLREDTLAVFDRDTDRLRKSLLDRLDRAQDQFIDSAVQALQSHIDSFGEVDNWSHEPSSLRMIMRTAYNSAVAKLRRNGVHAMEDIAEGASEILLDDLFIHHDSSNIDFPQQPQHRPPTNLAKTLSLDLGGGWWRRFWRFGRRNRAENRYRGLIRAEIGPLIKELVDDYFDEAVGKSREVVTDFFGDQARFILAVMDKATSDDLADSAPHDGSTPPEIDKRSAA